MCSDKLSFLFLNKQYLNVFMHFLYKKKSYPSTTQLREGKMF